MARRKKNAPPMDINQKCSHCDKVFKRLCDLNKHETTHSRPWKCTEPNCKYFQNGWPTEKERDRHINDKHSNTPNLYKCHFQPCIYASTRKSNCKQHMEKAHGWVYVRSMNKARSKPGSSLRAALKAPSGSTAASKPNPVAGPRPSSQGPPMFPDTLPFNNPPAPDSSADYPPLFETSPYPISSADTSGYFDALLTSANPDAIQAQSEGGGPSGLIPVLEMCGPSMNSMSTSSVGFALDLMRPSMSFDGSPMATTECSSFNSDFGWSYVSMPSRQEDHTALHMQLHTLTHSGSH